MSTTTEHAEPDPSLVYTPDEVAELMKVSGSTVRRWVREGEMFGIKSAYGARRGAVRIPKVEVERFLAEGPLRDEDAA